VQASDIKVNVDAGAGILPTITSAMSATALTVFFNAYIGSSAVVIATSMDASQIAAVVAGVAKIGATSITGSASLSVADEHTLTAKLNTSATITISDTASNINTGMVAIITDIAKIDTIDASDTGTIIIDTNAHLSTITNAKLTLGDNVQVTLANTNSLASAINIDKVDVGISTLTGSAQGSLAAVDASGEWFFLGGTLSYWNAGASTPSVESVTLIGVNSVSVTAGVFTLTV
jgi:hypothetical protein